MTENELLEILYQAKMNKKEEDEEEGWMTVRELAYKLKMSRKWVRNKLFNLKVEKKLDKKNVMRQGLNDRYQSVPAYRLKVDFDGGEKSKL